MPYSYSHVDPPPPPPPRGLQRDVVYLGWPIAPSYVSPNAGGGRELRRLSQWVQLCTWSPNKRWRSNSIFNLSPPNPHTLETLILPLKCDHLKQSSPSCGLVLWPAIQQWFIVWLSGQLSPFVAAGGGGGGGRGQKLWPVIEVNCAEEKRWVDLFIRPRGWLSL